MVTGLCIAVSHSIILFGENSVISRSSLTLFVAGHFPVTSRKTITCVHDRTGDKYGAKTVTLKITLNNTHSY